MQTGIKSYTPSQAGAWPGVSPSLRTAGSPVGTLQLLRVKRHQPMFLVMENPNGVSVTHSRFFFPLLEVRPEFPYNPSVPV